MPSCASLITEFVSLMTYKFDGVGSFIRTVLEYNTSYFFKYFKIELENREKSIMSSKPKVKRSKSIPKKSAKPKFQKDISAPNSNIAQHLVYIFQIVSVI
jgi:hypothetical protein